jgi:predicted molibdopterin-dependent oxidoreductase YjgC
MSGPSDPASPGRLPGERGGPLERLTQPLVREGGVLRPASWDEALDRAAAGFAKAKELGPNGFGMFSCSKTTNEMNFMAQKFTRVVMGSNNVDSCNRT